jgi:hypothetical protein
VLLLAAVILTNLAERPAVPYPSLLAIAGAGLAAAGQLAHVVAGCADNEIGHPRNHATLSRLAHALRDAALGIQHAIDAAPAAIKEP